MITDKRDYKYKPLSERQKLIMKKNEEEKKLKKKKTEGKNFIVFLKRKTGSTSLFDLDFKTQQALIEEWRILQEKNK